MDWGKIASEYGLPLTMLLVFGASIITGKLVPGPTHEDVKKQRDKALEQVYRMAEALTPGGKGHEG
jgi:hypothetical protein